MNEGKNSQENQGNRKGELVLVKADPAQFTLVVRAQVLGGICWTSPVLSNGRIYARNAAGLLAGLAAAR